MTTPSPQRSLAEIDFSCRLPLLILFVSAAVWLVIASALGMVASLQFHRPDLLAGCEWMSYGRLHPAARNSLVYGCLLQAGFGTALWLTARLGRTLLVQRGLVTVGAIFWNLGVTVGVPAILAGDSTGFENFEMPRYAAVICFLGYLFIGIPGVLTFHRRREPQLFVSQWFLFAAWFWFPWIFSTAGLLLTVFPVRGVVQAIITWWYSNNLVVVWLALTGMGAAFYFVPKLCNRDLHSRYLGLFSFWTFLLVAPWGGIPNSAPVPAWMPALSTVATVLTVVPALAFGWAMLRTAWGAGTTQPSLGFVLFGAGAFVLAAILKLAEVLDPHQLLHFTWFASGRGLLHSYGFFAMILFGAVYYILPQLTGTPFPRAGLIRAHFWLAAGGVLLLAVPQMIGGGVEWRGFQDLSLDFIHISKGTLLFLRASTLGDVALLLGNLAFLVNVTGLVWRFYSLEASAAYGIATAPLFKSAEAKS